MLDREHVREFVLAGNAIFTVVSKATGNRFTYKSTMADPEKMTDGVQRWWVKVLTGSDNESDYTFVGTITLATVQGADGLKSVVVYSHSRKSRIKQSALSIIALQYFLRNIDNLDYSKIEVYHEGRCGRCGRLLTVPESVESGYGPDCINLINQGK